MASPSTVKSRPDAVDVGRPDLDAQAPALGDGGRDLLRVVPEGGQHGRHVLDRVVRLEVRGLVRDQAVAGGVGLVEPVALERLERLEHRVDGLGRDAPLGRLRSTNFSFIERRTADFFLRMA